MFDWQPLTHSCEWRVAVYLNSMASDFPLDDSRYSNDQKSINLRTEKCKNGIFIILLVLFSHQGYKSQFFLCSCCFRFNILILKVWNYFTFVFACGYKRWPSLLENIFVQNASNANKISSHKLLLATLEPHWQVYFWTQERRKKHSIADGLTIGGKRKQNENISENITLACRKCNFNTSSICCKINSFNKATFLQNLEIKLPISK